MDAAPTPSALVARRWQAAIDDASAGRHAPCVSARPGCGRIAARSGRPTIRATSSRSQPTGRRTPHHQTDIGVDRAQRRRNRGGCGACPHVGRGDEHDQVGGIRGDFDRRRQPARQIADDGCAAASAGVDHRGQRSGLDVVAFAGTRQHAEPVPLRQRLAQRGDVEPAVLQCEIGPTQSRLFLAADHQIDATAPRVGIDKESVGRGLRKSGREQRGPRTSAACHQRRRPRPVRPSSRRDSAASDSAATSSASSAGRVMTRWAPTAIAASHSAACGSVWLSRMTCPRRGSAGSGAAAGPRGVEQHGRCSGPGLPARRLRNAWTTASTRSGGDAGRRRRASPIRRPWRGRRWLRSSAQSAGAHRPNASASSPPVDEVANCGWNGCQRGEPKTLFRNYDGLPHLSGQRKGPEKGRPPPGGEEAEVVVYQPRGVGLMHTRHKPSNPHYTHGKPKRRK